MNFCDWLICLHLTAVHLVDASRILQAKRLVGIMLHADDQRLVVSVEALEGRNTALDPHLLALEVHGVPDVDKPIDAVFVPDVNLPLRRALLVDERNCRVHLRVDFRSIVSTGATATGTGGTATGTVGTVSVTATATFRTVTATATATGFRSTVVDGDCFGITLPKTACVRLLLTSAFY